MIITEAVIKDYFRREDEDRTDFTIEELLRNFDLTTY